MFALVDCNNFYCSCERLFDPSLRGQPLIVLSNNDGCVISRTAEAKALGLPMTAPLHEVIDLVRRHNVNVRSSNYELYQDMSDRVMRTLHTLSPNVEVYSIDEAFVDVGQQGPIGGLENVGKELKQRVEQWVGLPVCVGIASTKTLAKLANYAAKKYRATEGVVDLSDPTRVERLLTITPVNHIWGIGCKQSAKLRSFGVTTALDLVRYSPKQIRQHFSVVMARTQQELQGEVCSPLSMVDEPRKHILCSRAFGHKQRNIESIGAALAFHVHRAAAKLRKDRSLTGHIKISLKTNPFAMHDAQYHARLGTHIVPPTNDTRRLLQYASELLTSVYQAGFPYHKVGVALSELSSDSQVQFDMLNAIRPESDPKALMQVIDAINQRTQTQIAPATTLKKDTRWRMRRRYLSPAYTTQWSDLPETSKD